MNKPCRRRGCESSRHAPRKEIFARAYYSTISNIAIVNLEGELMGVGTQANWVADKQAVLGEKWIGK
jgi:hypothetical protein